VRDGPEQDPYDHRENDDGNSVVGQYPVNVNQYNQQHLTDRSEDPELHDIILVLAEFLEQ